jgi:hypothetical protein
MKTIHSFIRRALMLPFVACLLLIHYLDMCIMHTITFALRGGELKTFGKDALEKKETKG